MVVSKVSVYLLLCFGLFGAVSSSDSSILDEFRQELEELKAITALQAKQLMNANNEIKVLKALNVATEVKLKSAENEIENLKTTTTTMQQNADREIRSLREEIEISEHENQQQNEINTSKRFVLPNTLAEKPAFSASLNTHATNLGNDQTIVFDHTFSNDLGAYSPISGVFTAPMNGTYFFTATVMSFFGQYVESDICLNGNDLVYMFSQDTSHEQGTNSVVLNLKVGDLVWVRHRGTEGFNAHGGHWSSFSGFMI